MRAITSAHVFEGGFRIFFLATAVYAVVLLPLWIAYASGVINMPLPSPAGLWHVHELVFGMITAAIAGFLLTAISNWTGVPLLSGRPLALLFLLWLSGRIVMATYGLLPPILVAVVDIAFLPALALYVGKQLIASGNRRNLFLCGVLVLLALGNLLFHLEFSDIGQTLIETPGEVTILIVLFLIVVIGGRIIPAFTRNWLVKQGREPDIPQMTALDKASITAVLAVLIVEITAPDSMPAAALAALAGMLNLVRLMRWQGVKVLSNSLLWVLHLGYLWVPVALGFKALALVAGDVSGMLWVHAAGVGAAAGMILAVMARASLGHTSRALRSLPGMGLAYLLISIAAVMRMLADGWDGPFLHLSLLAWELGFLLFIANYWPVLAGGEKKAGNDRCPAGVKRERAAQPHRPSLFRACCLDQAAFSELLRR